LATNVATLTAKLTADTSGLKRGLSDADRDVKSFGQKSKAGFQKFGKAAVLAGGVAAVAVAGFAAKGVAEFAKFEKGMNEVFTLLPGISQEAMDDMEDQVKDFSKEFGVLPDEVIPSLYQAISAGVPKDNVFEFMEVASKAAIGGVVPLETAVDGITSVINAYGKENITAAHASDLMFTAVRLGKTTMDELSRSLFQVNPVAAAMGIEFGDVTAALATMTAQGTPTRVATTQLRQALVELGKGGTEAFKHFEAATGQTFPDFIAGGGTVEEAFMAMKGRADDMGVGVGDLFGSVEAGMGVISLTSDSGAEAFGTAMDEMQDAAGATDAAFETMDQGLSRSWDKIKTAVNVAVLDMGEQLAPFVDQVAVWFTENLPAFIDTAMGWFDKIVGAVQNFVTGAFKIRDWFSSLPKPVGDAAKAVGLLTVALTALYANPILAGLALVALAVASIGAEANAEKDTIQGLVGDLETLGTISVTALEDMFGADTVQRMRDAGVSIALLQKAVSGTDEDVIAFKNSVHDLAGESDALEEVEGHIYSTLNENSGVWDAVTAEVEALRLEERKLIDQAAELATRQGEQEELHDKVAQAAGRNATAMEKELIPAGEETIELFQDMADEAEAWEKIINEEIDDVVNGFSSLADDMGVSTDDFIGNLVATESATQAWEANLALIAAAGMDNLHAELVEGGIETRDTVAAFTQDWNAAVEAELRLDGIIGPEITNVQETLDSLDISDAKGSLATLKSELGLSASEAQQLFDKLLQLNGTSVEFDIVGTYTGPKLPDGYLPPPPPGAKDGMMHSGGIVGGALGTDEVLRVLQKGEGVLDRDTMRAGIPGAGGGVTVIVEGNLFGASTVDDLADIITEAQVGQARRGQ